MLTVNISGTTFSLTKLSNKCPYCHQRIIPYIIAGHKPGSRHLEVFFKCPDINCHKSFIGYYTDPQGNSFNWSGTTSIGNLNRELFHESINLISPYFQKIYNEAYQAEQHNLSEICGVGYRKALEFLIKDYSISKNPGIEALIKKKPLAQCIKDYVNDNRIKDVALRAVWLGNDETHYVRKWEGKDLNDLKTIIKITLHWIEMEELTRSIIDDMPE